tara:strand:- start:971 stop:1867 length:897 start_codon:yes stop_codon:yes gene_type:complete
MAEHDYSIANDTGANVRADINNALSAIASNNSKATEPSTTFAYMWWADTANDLLKQRNAANNAWISILTLSTGVPIAGAGISNVVEDTTPQLGGDLDLNSNDITGTGGIPAANLTGSVATARLGSGTASSSVFLRGDSTWASAGGGKVLQVVSSTLTSGFTTTASSLTEITGLSCAITPSASSSKVYIMVDIGNVSIPATHFGAFQLRRDSTEICIGDQVGSSRDRVTAPLYGPDTGSRYFGMNFLDSPSTTSATNYYLYGFCESSGKLSINQLDGDSDDAIQGARGASTMTLMEIGA